MNDIHEQGSVKRIYLEHDHVPNLIVQDPVCDDLSCEGRHLDKVVGVGGFNLLELGDLE